MISSQQWFLISHQLQWNYPFNHLTKWELGNRYHWMNYWAMNSGINHLYIYGNRWWKWWIKKWEIDHLGKPWGNIGNSHCFTTPRRNVDRFGIVAPYSRLNHHWRCREVLCFFPDRLLWLCHVFVDQENQQVCIAHNQQAHCLAIRTSFLVVDLILIWLSLPFLRGNRLG